MIHKLAAGYHFLLNYQSSLYHVAHYGEILSTGYMRCAQPSRYAGSVLWSDLCHSSYCSL